MPAHDAPFILTQDELSDDLALGAVAPLRLSAAELARLGELRAALTAFRETREPAALERGLVAVRELLSTLARSDRPHLEELRRLAGVLPEFGELLSLAAAEAGRAVAPGYDRLWLALGLQGPVPRWNDVEHEAARMVFACACGPGAMPHPESLRASLRRIASSRLARLICADLCHSEQVWQTALGDRYGSLRHRCAPRTLMRSRGLAELLAGDGECREAVTHRLERWVAAGGHPHELAGELEAAVVHARTPARLA
jgi:hypothetical protein